MDVVLVFHDVIERQRAEEIWTRLAALEESLWTLSSAILGWDHDELEPERRAVQASWLAGRIAGEKR